MSFEYEVVLTPSGRLRNEEYAQAKEERKQDLNGKWSSPLVVGAFDEVKPYTDPAGQCISHTDHDTMHTHEQSPNFSW